MTLPLEHFKQKPLAELMAICSGTIDRNIARRVAANLGFRDLANRATTAPSMEALVATIPAEMYRRQYLATYAYNLEAITKRLRPDEKIQCYINSRLEEAKKLNPSSLQTWEKIRQRFGVGDYLPVMKMLRIKLKQEEDRQLTEQAAETIKMLWWIADEIGRPEGPSTVWGDELAARSAARPLFANND